MSEFGNDNLFAEAMSAGSALVRHHFENNDPFAIVPEGYKLEDLERFKATPRHTVQTIQLKNAEDFVEYVKRFAIAGTTLFADLENTKFTAILDFPNDSNETAWGDHKALYSCPLSRSWKIWEQADGKSMDQQSFAKFIEDNLPDIVDPNGSDILSIAQTLEAKKKLEFKSGVKLSNGEVQLTYNEEIRGTANNGTLNIPDTFTLGIQVFEGGDTYKLEARLRYRIPENGQLVMWFDLLRPDRLLDDAFNTLSEFISTEMEDVACVYHAVAPK